MFGIHKSPFFPFFESEGRSRVKLFDSGQLCKILMQIVDDINIHVSN